MSVPFIAQDGVDIIARSPGRSFFLGKDANGKFIVGGIQQRTGPGAEQSFSSEAAARSHFQWLISEYE